MKTGWILDKGTWYFLNPSGAMATGWILDRGTWYYLQSSGAMKTGWLSYKGSWYFLKSSGAMASNEMIQDKGEKYYLEQSGAMVTGWKQVNSDKYYFNGSGAAVKGVYTIGSDTYYFKTDSCKLLINGTENEITTDAYGTINYDKTDGFKTVDGKTYCFEYGKMLTGLQYAGPNTFGGYYYFDKDGVMQKGWITDEKGNKYYAYSNGIVASGANKIDGKLYLFDPDFKLYTTPGYKYGSFVKEDGTLYTGWKTIDGKKCYFNDDGKIVSGIVKIGNEEKPYYFDCTSNELVCNANYYGFSTNEKGQVTNFNYDTVKKDIQKNASEELKELENQYGEVTLKYISFEALRNRGTNTQYSFDEDQSREENTFNTNEYMFKYEARAIVNGKEKIVGQYFVSAMTKGIYTYKEDGTYVDEETGKKHYYDHSLRQIKDNKIVNVYYINTYCV